MLRNPRSRGSGQTVMIEVGMTLIRLKGGRPLFDSWEHWWFNMAIRR